MKYVNRSQSLPDIRLRRLELQREALTVSSQDNRCPQGADDLSPAERASPVYSSPATYAVGQIHELVDLILGFASKLSLYNCLFVCKAYSNIANKHIWRDLPSAIPLLKLLGPTGTLDSGTWVFRDLPSQMQRENFHAHAKYVETISQPSCAWNRGTTDLDWPIERMQSYKERDVDPESGPKCCRPGFCPIHYYALEMFETGKSMASPLCLTPNLERLTFTFGNVDTPPTSFLSFLAPNLITLNLLYHICPWTTYDPYYEWHISKSLHALSGWDHRSVLRHLRRLQIRFDDGSFPLYYGYGQVNDAILGVLDHCTQLRCIKLPPFLKHERLLSTIQKFHQLSSLSVSFDAPGQMVSFAQGIADSLPNLRKLGLGHRGDASTPKEQLFKPLLKLRNLVEFTIENYAQTEIVDLEDEPPWLLTLPFLQELSTAWPELESLRLHPSNYVHMKSLESFQDSELFPKLTYLAIDIENIIYRLTIPMSAVAAAVRLMRPLRSLRLLDIGTRVDTSCDGSSEPFALITYAERLGPSGMRILVNGESPRGKSSSVA